MPCTGTLSPPRPARPARRVALFGHSYGAGCAMGAATRNDNVHHLVLYEPALGLRFQPGSVERMEKDLAAGDRDAVISAMFRDVFQMTDEQIDAVRASPVWPLRLAAAATLPRECRVEHDWVCGPATFAGITAPTLFLAGSESPVPLGAATAAPVAAVPGARVRVLEGHAHLAHRTDPDLIAEIIGDFTGS